MGSQTCLWTDGLDAPARRDRSPRADDWGAARCGQAGHAARLGRIAALCLPTLFVAVLLILTTVSALAQAGNGGGLPPLSQVTVSPTDSVIDVRPSVREIIIRPDVPGLENEPGSGERPSDLAAGRWLMISLTNPSRAPQTRIMVLQTPTLAGSGPFGAGASGFPVKTAVQWAEGAPAQPLIWVNTRDGAKAYEVRLAPGQNTTVALSVGLREAPYSLALWQPAAYQRLERWIAAGKGIAFGVLMVLVALSAGRWVLHGDAEDFATTGLAAAGFLFVAAGFGVQYSVVPPEYSLSGGFRAAALAALAAAGLQVMRRRLMLERLNRHMPLYFDQASGLLAGLALLSIPGIGPDVMAGPAVMITAFSSAAIIILLSRRRDRQAAALLPGAALFCLCAVAGAMVSVTGPGPFAGLQALLLTGAVAAGVSLSALASILARPAAFPADHGHGHDHPMGHDDNPARYDPARYDPARHGTTGFVPGSQLWRGPLPYDSQDGFGNDTPVVQVGNKVQDQAIAEPSAQGGFPEGEGGRPGLALEAAQEGVWDYDVGTDRLIVSPMVEAVLGLQVGRLGRSLKAWLERIHPDDGDMIRSAVESYIARGNIAFELEFRIFHEDQTYRWVSLRGSAMPGNDRKARRLIGVVADVSSRKNDEMRAIEDVMRDSLTGLANRGLLLDRLAHLLEGAARDQARDQARDLARDQGRGQIVPAVIVIDVDRFKTINEGLGQGEGDAMLVTLARRLEGLVSRDDTVARIGGDEFAVLLPRGLGMKDARARLRAVADSLGAPIVLDEQEVFPSVSIGAARADLGQDTPQDVLRNAEIALFRAKAKGYGEIMEFTPAMRQQSGGRLSLEAALQRAAERGELEVFYQPVMDLRPPRLAGFEAVIRWNHPELGLVPHDQFISIAEEMGAMRDIGHSALALVAARLRDWQRRWPSDPPLFINFGLSSGQFLGGEFADLVRGVLPREGLPRGSLRLGVRESLIMANPELSAQALRMLSDGGAGLVLEGFGTGFSAFTYLQRLPFETVKMDRSFVAALHSGGGAEAAKVTKALVTLAHDLSLTVIAEGPENDEDVRRLREFGCDYAQGLVFGGPLRPEAAESLLTHTLGPERGARESLNAAQ